ncbi:TraR/DksA family transcriptional regulator [Streptomyces zhihengii]|uniref:TraR/DksA family transcriptional regulator n=1 Tax=Streptomyces zhihengii TaxID=1818004 RepID=UPI0036446598
MNNQTAGVRTAGPAPEDLDALREGLREQRAFRREQLRRLSAPGPGPEDGSGPHRVAATAGAAYGSAPAAHGPGRDGAGYAPDRAGEAEDGAGRRSGPYAARPRTRSAGSVSRDRLAASARMVLADVEAALARMEEGRYGSCHLCARPIALARLTVVPQARYCGRCQHVREAGR